MFDVEPKQTDRSAAALVELESSEAGVQPAALAGAVPPPVKVIYITGSARSGSTLLDISLGQAPDVIGAGEMTTLTRHVWKNGELCACGDPVRDCDVWSRVAEHWSRSDTSSFMAAYRSRQSWREALVGPGRWIDRFLHRTPPPFERDTLKLFNAVAKVTGKPIVVDSSKLPGRGFALANMPGIDLYVLHVIRDGRGVVWSLRKPLKRDLAKGVQRDLPPKPLFYAALRWIGVNLAAERLCRYVGRDRSLRVRYEDFVADPEETVARILSLVRGTRAQEQILPKSGGLKPWHQMAGSRHRMQPSIRVREDESWRHAMPPREQRRVTRLCGFLLRRYDYLGRSA